MKNQNEFWKNWDDQKNFFSYPRKITDKLFFSKNVEVFFLKVGIPEGASPYLHFLPCPELIHNSLYYVIGSDFDDNLIILHAHTKDTLFWVSKSEVQGSYDDLIDREDTPKTLLKVFPGQNLKTLTYLNGSIIHLCKIIQVYKIMVDQAYKYKINENLFIRNEIPDSLIDHFEAELHKIDSKLKTFQNTFWQKEILFLRSHKERFKEGKKNVSDNRSNMKIFGYSKKYPEDLLEMSEITFQADPKSLKIIAELLLNSAKEIEKDVNNEWNHVHLQDTWSDWEESLPDVIVSKI